MKEQELKPDMGENVSRPLTPADDDVKTAFNANEGLGDEMKFIAKIKPRPSTAVRGSAGEGAVRTASTQPGKNVCAPST